MSIEIEQHPVDVLFVGAGPASLAGAIHLARLIKAHNERVQAGESGQALSPLIAVLEKGAAPGAQQISGGVLDPGSLRKLFPDLEAAGVPLETPITLDQLWHMSESAHEVAPHLPRSLRNDDGYLISLQALTAFLGRVAEEEGVTIASGFPGTGLLFDERERVTGVRTKRRVPGESGHAFVDFRASITVLGEGTRGSLTKVLIEKKRLDAGKASQVWSLGLKEIWRIKPEHHHKGLAVHTTGYPLRLEEFGGGYVYHLDHERVALGLVVGLDYPDPRFDPHHALQRFKAHPTIARMLAGGEMLGYGARSMPEGGYDALPQLYTDGALLIGDSAGFFNPIRLKGVHLAIESGLAAAESIFEALRADDFSAEQLADYARRIESGPVGQELYRFRRLHQGPEDGLLASLVAASLQATAHGAINPEGPGPSGPPMMTVARYYGAQAPHSDAPAFDGVLTRSKEASVYFAGLKAGPQGLPHLAIADVNLCNTRCKEEYGNPCQQFCPAAVYTMAPHPQTGEPHLKLNPTYCLHCKTCDIVDPYQNITWSPPEGGAGPVYHGM